MVNIDIVYFMNNKTSNFNIKKFKEFVKNKESDNIIIHFIKIKNILEFYDLFNSGENVMWNGDLNNYKTITYFPWYHPDRNKECNILDNWEWHHYNSYFIYHTKGFHY